MPTGEPGHLNQEALDCWADLVVSVLSVNNRSVERTYEILPELQETGLVDPEVLKALDSDEVFWKLKQAGYHRSEFMNRLLARRLAALGAFITHNGIEAATAMILARDRRALEKTLAGIYGIGPAVIKNFYVLRGI